MHNPGGIQLVQQFGQWTLIPAAAEGFGQVVMGVDHGEFCPVDAGFLDD
ncbi:MAG: hypothetical protein WCK35_06310 [Chloroflexota bacterium]